MKRILLSYSDPLIARIHRERLEAAGCEVLLGEERGTALRILEEKPVDLIVIDLLREDGDGVDFALALKGGVNGRKAPFLALPSVPREMEAMVAQVGIAIVSVPFESSGKEPRNVLLDAMDRAMGHSVGTLAGAYSSEAVERNWRKSCIEGAVESALTLRKQVVSLAQEPESAEPLQQALRTAHHLQQRSIEAGLLPMHQLASALSGLIHELLLLPAALNASTLRTLTQAVDFLGTSVEPKALSTMQKLQASVVFAVDDDALTCRAIASSLATIGLHTRSALTPAAALQSLDSLRCDLIILDIGLPEMNGFELCKSIRRLPWHQHTPIIFLTGLATFQNRVQSSLVSGCDFVAKPFNVFELPVKALVWISRARLALN